MRTWMSSKGAADWSIVSMNTPNDGAVMTSTLPSAFHWSMSEIARSKVPSMSPFFAASRRVWRSGIAEKTMRLATGLGPQ